MTQPLPPNPFLESGKVNWRKSFPSKMVIDTYQKYFQMDVAEYFEGIEQFQMFECMQSGYRFYHPFSMGGKSALYEEFQKLNWYYLPWKWEHDVCKSLVKKGDYILEVGCGRGDFIKNISKQIPSVQCTGLELNRSAAIEEGGLKILNTTIESYAAKNPQAADLVCSFQVLEHISQVRPFLGAMVQSLKPGGLLVICVPNNDSFIKHDFTGVLNLPPHHMGLWNEKSLKFIGTQFNLGLEKIVFEPLQPYHFDWYTAITMQHLFGLKFGNALISLFQKTKINKILNLFLKLFSTIIRGHSILIVFRKEASVLQNGTFELKDQGQKDSINWKQRITLKNLFFNLKHALNWIYNPIYRELDRISKLPRYTTHNTSLMGVPWTFNDGLSFVSTYREIIINKIYSFNPSTSQPLIIDCGANMGLGIWFFKEQFPDARIIAFEPDPDIFKVLNENMIQNRLTGIELHQKAVWKQDGEIFFEKEGGDAGRLDLKNESPKTIKVEAVNLNPWLANEKVDLLKIDIEGAETEVLRSIQPHLKNVFRIFVEYHSFENQPQTLGELISILTNAGFRVHASPVGHSPQPFIKRNAYLGIDLQFNIYGYRD